MQTNVGALDATIRIMLGFALLFVGFIIPAPLRYFAFAGFLLLAVTGFGGTCPLYTLLGMRTCEDPARRA
jgi:hypothetical protein